MIKYSIHTLELYAQLSPHDYNYFYSVLSDMNLSIEKTEYPLNKTIENRTYTYRHFNRFAGINSISLKTTKSISFTRYYVHIYINPYNALYRFKHSNAGIIGEGQIEEAIIYTHLNSLFSIFPLTAYLLKRLDFCLDIKFPTQKQADEYIKLLKKSIPRKSLNEKTYFDHTQRRHIPYKDS